MNLSIPARKDLVLKTEKEIFVDSISELICDKIQFAIKTNQKYICIRDIFKKINNYTKNKTIRENIAKDIQEALNKKGYYNTIKSSLRAKYLLIVLNNDYQEEAIKELNNIIRGDTASFFFVIFIILLIIKI